MGEINQVIGIALGAIIGGIVVFGIFFPVIFPVEPISETNECYAELVEVRKGIDFNNTLETALLQREFDMLDQNAQFEQLWFANQQLNMINIKYLLDRQGLVYGFLECENDA